MLRVLWVLTIAVWAAVNTGIAQEVRQPEGDAPQRAIGARTVDQAAPEAEQRATRASRTRSAVRRAPEGVVARPRVRSEKAPDRKTTVIRLKYAPAQDVARAITQFLNSEREVLQQYSRERSGPNVVVVPDVVTNSLILSAEQQHFEEVVELIEKLDARPQMLLLQMLVVEVEYNEGGKTEGAGAVALKASGDGVDAVIERLLKLDGLDSLRVLARPQITTLDNQPATIQIAQRKPRVAGSAVSPRGRTNNVTFENVGLKVGVRPRISADGLVTMEIDVEDSRFGSEREAVPIAVSDDNVIRTPQMGTVTLETTVSVSSGESLALGGMVSKSETGWRELVIVVTPTVIDGQD